MLRLSKIIIFALATLVYGNYTIDINCYCGSQTPQTPQIPQPFSSLPFKNIATIEFPVDTCLQQISDAPVNCCSSGGCNVEYDRKLHNIYLVRLVDVNHAGWELKVQIGSYYYYIGDKDLGARKAIYEMDFFFIVPKTEIGAMTIWKSKEPDGGIYPALKAVGILDHIDYAQQKGNFLAFLTSKGTFKNPSEVSSWRESYLNPVYLDDKFDKRLFNIPGMAFCAGLSNPDEITECYLDVAGVPITDSGSYTTRNNHKGEVFLHMHGFQTLVDESGTLWENIKHFSPPYFCLSCSEITVETDKDFWGVLDIVAEFVGLVTEVVSGNIQGAISSTVKIAKDSLSLAGVLGQDAGHLSELVTRIAGSVERLNESQMEELAEKNVERLNKGGFKSQAFAVMQLQKMNKKHK